ncbi:MAG: NAD(+) synthase [Candidatus Onthomonas sp.]
MKDGFLTVAAGTPEIRVADCAYNAGQIIALMEEAAGRGVKVLCLPELCVTGYTCGDLFLQSTLLRGAEDALGRILAETAALDLVAALGFPYRHQGKLYNCAAVIHRGRILGLVPKINIPNYTEFYEARWFTSGRGLEPVCVSLCGQSPELSANQVFRCENLPGLTIGVEICEDLWVADTPSTRLAAGGATLILNPSASDEIVCKDSYRRSLVSCTSGRLVCGYVYADAGKGESSTDLIYGAHNLIAENGSILAQRRFETGLTVSEIDLEKLTHERQRMSTFPTAAPGIKAQTFALELGETALTRYVAPNPFVPADLGDRAARCQEILTLAALGLRKRLEHTRARTAVIGLSGGLDSTLAILITKRAMDLLGRPASDILAVTMPCYGTTERTKSNAVLLAEELGATLKTVDIGDAVSVHFRDIGQSMEDHSVTFENGQARERTQVLMDLANKTWGMVVGTGDLSELALGWATYNGDHMSMYAVNASIPKTLVRHLVAYVRDEHAGSNSRLSAVLQDILDTPVSPELLPAVNGEIAQKTEDLVGPYELHDFFLYYAIRWGFGPAKVYRLAVYAFRGHYEADFILKWLENFYRRFFAQQFKRSCLPDGPKVGTVTLSPRGDWRMPSDAVASLWMKEVEALKTNL